MDENDKIEMPETDGQQALPQESDQSLMVGYFDCEMIAWANQYPDNPHAENRFNIVWQWLSRYHPGQVLLDYGCGSGILLKALVEAGFKVTGVDISENRLAEATDNLQTLLKKNNIRLVQVDAQLDGAYADRFYDGIISLGVIEYANDHQALLERFHTLLKPGGFLIMSFPNRASWLRGVEQWIFKYANWFRPFRLFPHLTGKDSYLQFQRRQWTLSEFKGLLEPRNYQLNRACYHVAPAFLKAWEGQSSVGMTAITEFIKQKF